MSSSWGHDPGALGILAEAVGSEYTAQSVLNEVAEDGWALLHRSASPWVRLSRWLDGRPQRRPGEWHQLIYGGYRVDLIDGGTGTVWAGYGNSPGAALSAALDQAEGVTS